MSRYLASIRFALKLSNLLWGFLMSRWMSQCLRRASIGSTDSSIDPRKLSGSASGVFQHSPYSPPLLGMHYRLRWCAGLDNIYNPGCTAQHRHVRNHRHYFNQRGWVQRTISKKCLVEPMSMMLRIKLNKERMGPICRLSSWTLQTRTGQAGLWLRLILWWLYYGDERACSIQHVL